MFSSSDVDSEPSSTSSRFHADIVAQLSTALRADFAAAAQHAGVVLAEDAEKAEAGDAASVKTQADTLT